MGMATEDEQWTISNCLPASSKATKEQSRRLVGKAIVLQLHKSLSSLQNNHRVTNTAILCHSF